jgi:aspartyl-tRNA(Asn)/glutamyl-tRNA(Gln) amidotransferase subunit C
MTARVSVEDVERVAELANLELTPDESVTMLHDLNAILDHVAHLNELDTTGVAPLEQVGELFGAGGVSVLRQDERRPSLDRGVVMPQAPETDQAFFKVPKVIER